MSPGHPEKPPFRMYQTTKSSSVFSPDWSALNSLHWDFQEFSSHIKTSAYVLLWATKMWISASNFSQSIFQFVGKKRSLSLNNIFTHILDILHGGRSCEQIQEKLGCVYFLRLWCLFSDEDVFYSARHNVLRICLWKKILTSRPIKVRWLKIREPQIILVQNHFILKVPKFWRHMLHAKIEKIMIACWDFLLEEVGVSRFPTPTPHEKDWAARTVFSPAFWLCMDGGRLADRANKNNKNKQLKDAFNDHNCFFLMISRICETCAVSMKICQSIYIYIYIYIYTYIYVFTIYHISIFISIIYTK